MIYYVWCTVFWLQNIQPNIKEWKNGACFTSVILILFWLFKKYTSKCPKTWRNAQSYLNLLQFFNSDNLILSIKDVPQCYEVYSWFNFSPSLKLGSLYSFLSCPIYTERETTFFFSTCCCWWTFLWWCRA